MNFVVLYMTLLRSSKKMRKEVAEWKQKYFEQEQRYIMPLYPAARELGFDLQQLVHDNPGKNCT